MGWERIPGLKGKIYIPDARPGQPKKHPCPDCHACQMCSEDRCNVCRTCCKSKKERDS